MCNDFEDIEQISKWSIKWGALCGLTVSHDDIIQALRGLIEQSYAKAYDLDRWQDEAMSREEITPLNPRFARTEEGLALHKASSGQSRLIPEVSSRRGELVREFILDSFANCTHIHLAHLERTSQHLADQHGIKVSRAERIQALKELIAPGFLKASYKDEGAWRYDGMPPIEDIKPFGAYFWTSGAGWDYLESNPSWWPFEDDGDGEWKLRSNWIPPQR
jgi:hypothetical protein